MNRTIAVFGCGNMGGSMVEHLLASGISVSCFDPDSSVRDRMARLGANTTDSPTSLAQTATVIILSLPKAQIVESVMTTIAPHIPPGAVVLDTSTSVPATSQAMCSLGKAHGFDFIDGPVSGGPAAAKSGSMTMLLAGDQGAIKRIQPIIEVLTAKTVYVGPSGAGHAAKIANNMLCAANLVLVAEAVRLGEASGVSPSALLEGINAGSGRSGVSEVNFPKWVLNEAFDSGFTMGLMRKDVRLAIALAEQSGVAMPAFQELADIWLNHSVSIDDTADFNRIAHYQPTDELNE